MGIIPRRCNIPTNQYFNNYYNAPEQKLFDDLSVEFVKMYGLDFLYLKRSVDSYDELHKEAEVVSYNSNHAIEMYIKNYYDYEGEQKFMDFQGMAIDDRLKLSVVKTSFMKEVGDKEELIRPREGDLLYFPLAKRLFTITFVKQEEAFFQFGTNLTWEISANLYISNSEIFNTGFPEIDDAYNNLSTTDEAKKMIDTDLNDMTDMSNFDIFRPEDNIEQTALQSQNNVLSDKFEEIDDPTEHNLGGWR